MPAAAGKSPTPAALAPKATRAAALKKASSSPKQEKAPPPYKPAGLTVSASGNVAKRDALDLWEKLPDDRRITIEAKPAGRRGSAFATGFSIRTTGRLSEIKDFLSRNKWLLKYDNSSKTRLDIKLSMVKGKHTQVFIGDQWSLYILICERTR